MSQDKPREWFLYFPTFGLKQWFCHTERSAAKADGLFNEFHVIEYSAYSALKAENDRLRERLKVAVDGIESILTVFQTNWKCGTCVEVNNDCYKPLSNLYNKLSEGGE